MAKRRLLLIVLLAGATSAASCGTPTTPSSSAFDASGNWTVKFVSGTVFFGAADCVGTTIFSSATAPTFTSTMQITQSGAALSGTGSSTILHNALSYVGNAEKTSFDLTAVAGAATVLSGFQCSSGDLRDLRLVQSVIQLMSIDGNTVSGSESDQYTVLLPGTQTAVGTLLLSSAIGGSLSMSK